VFTNRPAMRKFGIAAGSPACSRAPLRPNLGLMITDAHRSRRMRFGLTTALPRPAGEARDFAQGVEAGGFDVLTFADHLGPIAAPFTGATAAGVVTDRLHVGTLVLNNDFRHPVETAREAAGIATATGGRFELGIGAGHMKSEYDAAGLPFGGGGVRVSRLDESAPLIRALLVGEPVDFAGQHYTMQAVAGSLELNALIQAVVVTDDREAAAEELAASFGAVISPERLLNSPFVLLGTHEQMAEMLTERQQRFGVSYWTVFDELPGRPSAMADMAKVIALLR
jgi:luciferase-like monooxygenase